MVVVRRIPMHGPDGHLHVVWQQEGIREDRQQWSARRGSQKWHIEGRSGRKAPHEASGRYCSHCACGMPALRGDYCVLRA